MVDNHFFDDNRRNTKNMKKSANERHWRAAIMTYNENHFYDDNYRKVRTTNKNDDKSKWDLNFELLTKMTTNRNETWISNY